ncbi:tRNA 2-thiocytidine biosynthesis TtcA family protein [Scatolibacter rhodanostii]|uniref:tRNA 2-thiocytidine biosynthesis TtcA family protein n=1 Tax=Scatolibacter rhodanostii TaxID=2014781 RepID=UPI000C08610F|nr:tRNA 2-thiocytidine biosynthesis TtcA family protein [Scatolibacter rhodanostii]
MEKLIGHVRAAIEQYQMIEEGDRIAVGISGGKDSMFLLAALHSLSQYYPKKFTLVGVTADPCFGGQETDFSKISEFCAQRNIPYIIRKTRLGTIIFEENQEKNPCSLCARMRRGILHNICVEEGLNKIALGHHLDDAAQTFMMNLLYGGNIGCFSPKTYLSRKNLTMIRPLIFCQEKNIISAVRRADIPVVKSACPADGVTARKDTEVFLTGLQKDFPDIKQKIIGAMQRSNLDKWGI